MKNNYEGGTKGNLVRPKASAIFRNGFGIEIKLFFNQYLKS
jgi:hypothetical protein